MLSTPPPVILMLALATGVTVWQHVVGHTYTTAQSMHLPPIVLLTSISTCTGCVFFFIALAAISLARCAWTPLITKRKDNKENFNVRYRMANTFEYYDNEEEEEEFIMSQSMIHPGSSEHKHGKKPPRTDNDNNENNGGDIDATVYEKTGDIQTQNEQKANPTLNRDVLVSGDILTVNMVWTNVYGLGVSAFFLSYIVTMSSTLSTFSFVAGLSAVSLYEAIQERRFPMQRQWNVGQVTGQFRSAAHLAILLLCITSMSIIGVHVSGITMNHTNNIRTEDVFLGILGPISTPLMLKGVRRPHTTIIGTLETALPFTVFMCVTFIATSMAMGMRPYESPEEIARNVIAATTLLPFTWGISILYILYCTCRKRMVYVFSAFMVVLTGREVTLNKNSGIVVSSFVFAVCAFCISIIASNSTSIQWVSSRLMKSHTTWKDEEYQDDIVEPVGRKLPTGTTKHDTLPYIRE